MQLLMKRWVVQYCCCFSLMLKMEKSFLFLGGRGVCSLDYCRNNPGISIFTHLLLFIAKYNSTSGFLCYLNCDKLLWCRLLVPSDIIHLIVCITLFAPSQQWNIFRHRLSALKCILQIPKSKLMLIDFWLHTKKYMFVVHSHLSMWKIKWAQL